MKRASKRKARRQRAVREDVNLHAVYSGIRKKLRRQLTAKDTRALEDFFVVSVKAAFSKCLDFNIAINANDVRNSDAFFYVAGLRGICEDLIVLRYLSQADHEARQDYLRSLLALNLQQGIAVQYKFFKANNPLQPLIGAPFPIGETNSASAEAKIEARLKSAQSNFRASAGRLGLGARPTVRSMAQSVGLVTTYDFIYFLASNYVHFNPGAFLKFGRTNEKDKDFTFSVSHMSNYYGATAIFYGSVLFVGFANFLLAVPEIAKVALKREIRVIERFIGSIHRWPEIVTFEEMNVQPPLFFMLHAMREVMKEDGALVYGQILEELKSGSEPPSAAM